MLARGRPPRLRSVAQREEGLGAPCGLASGGNLQDFFRSEVGFGAGWEAGMVRERAVAARVAAQPSEWDEDLTAVGDQVAIPCRQQCRECSPVLVDEGVGLSVGERCDGRRGEAARRHGDEVVRRGEREERQAHDETGYRTPARGAIIFTGQPGRQTIENSSAIRLACSHAERTRDTCI
eukprot:scaffold26660_cov60-Phaeocystis_antarctica.AAC.2